MSLTITATEYQAWVLNTQGRVAISLRHFLEQKLAKCNIAFLDILAERSAWLKAIGDLNLINKEVLISECTEAYSTMLLYGISPEELKGFDAQGIRLFRKLLRRFLQNKIRPTFLEALQYLQIKEALELFGFVDLPPLYQSIFKAPLVRGGAQSTEGIYAQQVWMAPNPESEFLSAVAEIEMLWQKHSQETFALVIQQNILPWFKIHRLLKTYPPKIPFVCSKAQMCADHPKFLFFKNLLASRNSTDLLEFSRVLISPFWPDDLERRAHLDVWMRDNLMRTISLAEVLDALCMHAPDIQNTEWFQLWSKIANFSANQVEAFAEDFLAKAAITPVIPWQAGIQPPHLHIVSALEAANLPVDRVWLLSADSDHYPLRKSPPAFLPKSLLLRKGVPVSVEAAREYGEHVFHAITGGKEVYVSFVSQVKGEEKHLRGFIPTVESAKISSLRGGAVLGPPIARNFRGTMGENRDRTPKVGNFEEGKVVTGGSQLLKEQAECPFKAFAHYRLQVRALGSGRELLDPMQKGILIHAALEKIWDELKSQQALLALNQEERQKLVARKVDTVLFTRQSSLLHKLERERLIRILSEWLNLEATRAPFTVEACELKTMVSIGSLQLHLRLDRIDRMGESRIIIDYKTGEVSSRGWFEERLREPQLPLYVVTNAAQGAIFASLKVGKMGYAGVVKDREYALDQVKVLDNWEKQATHWQAQLKDLAHEFLQSHAAVQPIDDKVCMYCDLSAFCRIKARLESC